LIENSLRDPVAHEECVHAVEIVFFPLQSGRYRDEISDGDVSHLGSVRLVLREVSRNAIVKAFYVLDHARRVFRLNALALRGGRLPRPF
jgi:hypothetical protein